MFLSSLAALGTFTVSLPAYVLLFQRAYSPAYRRLCLAIIFMGLAKLSRFRPVADTYVEPWMHSLTGVHNLPITFAATFAVAGYTTVLISSVSKTSARRWIIAAVAALTVAFWAAFIISYGGKASGRPSSDGLNSPTQVIFWALPLLIIIIVSSAITLIAIREVRQRPHGYGIGAPHGLILAGVGGILYSLNKIVHIALATINAPEWSVNIATIIGLIALPLTTAALALVVYSPVLSELINRIWRYRQLRAADSSLAATTAWTLAGDALKSHEFMVDVSDEEIMNAQRDTAN